MASVAIQWPNGPVLPAIGQGTWRMGEDPSQRAAEVAALQHGLDRGLTLIDTAEMYGEGGAEEAVGAALKGRRDKAFIVSKVYPHNASCQNMIKACDRSLQRLNIDAIDCYLLHWGSSTPTDEIIEGFVRLQEAGKIKGYGVSNLDDLEMEAWWQHDHGQLCQTDQVLYHLGSRGVEYRLLPLLRERHVPMMAYCPLAQGGRLRQHLMTSSAVTEVAQRHTATPQQILLAWVIREQQGQHNIIAIPKAVHPDHIDANMAALNIALTADDLALLDRSWPAPTRRQPLDVE